MGRRGGLRGRPGFVIIILFAACLTTFCLSWTLLSSAAKEVDSVKRSSWFKYSNNLKEISETNEQVSRRHGQGKDYSLGETFTSKAFAAPVFHQYVAADDKELTNESVASKESIKATVKIETQSFQADAKKLDWQLHTSIAKTVTSMEKYVHLDLKGAPPKMNYLMLFIRLVKRLGATGLLVEYEDMFPYTGILEHIRADNAYSKENINELVKFAEEAGLTLVPLIPTFGHMEFVLKSEFSKLRESDYTPQVIDITQSASYELISEMIKQVLEHHPRAKYLHIGCNEVYELGKGASATEMQLKNLTTSQMFLQHVMRVAEIVRNQASRVTPLIWDDELRQIHSEDLEVSGLPFMVEIVVWQYSGDVLHTIGNDVWDKYARLFKAVWIASSFKGSNEAGHIFTEPVHHLNNQLSWLNLIEAYNTRLTFRGVVLAGRQRYDHFSTLCELLPVAVPSLAVCLATMVNGGFTKDIHKSTSKLIRCNRPLEMTLSTHHHRDAYDCVFPGYELHYAVKGLYKLTVHGPDTRNRVEAWLSDYQVAHAFSNPGQLKVLATSLTEQTSSYYRISGLLEEQLAMIYTEETVDEWMEENVKQKLRRIKLLQDKIQSLLKNRSWPNRPLAVVVGTVYTDYPGGARTENNTQGHQLESDNVHPASQNQSRQPVILNTQSSDNETEVTPASQSQQK
ncbi:hypothetical protein BsWGS_00426 [Bradybaena similaris]